LALTLAVAVPLRAQTQATGNNTNSAMTPEQYAQGLVLADPRSPIISRPGALTLAQVIDIARTKNPTLLAAAQNLRAIRAQEIQAGVRANPYLTLNGSDLTYPSTASSPYTYTAQISRLFERGEKRRWRLDDARATTAQTTAQLEDTTRQTVLIIKTAFIQMLQAKASLQLTRAELQQFQHEVDIAHDRFQAGDLAKIDFERLDLQIASFESAESNDIVNLRQASDQLQTLMGVENPNPDFDITGDIVPPVLDQNLPRLIQTALDKRPDYAAAKFGVDVAVANQKLTFANGTTDPTLEAEYDRAGHENSVGFSVNIPLRIFDRNQGNKETSIFQTDASRFTLVAAKNQVVSDVDQAWISYTQSKRLSDRYTSHYLEEAKDVLSIAQFAFEHGGISLIDYIDAVRDTETINSAAISAYQQTWLAIHQLSAATASEIAP
jgi:cobalt-zinc-cadmium efflux system outer membrane protein